MRMTAIRKISGASNTCFWPAAAPYLVPSAISQGFASSVAAPRLVLPSGGLCEYAKKLIQHAAAMPHMSVDRGSICGIPMMLFRVSFTGELGLEVNVPADFGAAVWEAIYASGQRHGMV